VASKMVEPYGRNFRRGLLWMAVDDYVVTQTWLPGELNCFEPAPGT